MKKCSFFPVLLVALFMFLGFESSAQNYKPLPEAINLVSKAVDEAKTQYDNAANTDRITSANQQALAIEGMKEKIGYALLNEYKNNVDVSKAFDNVATSFNVNVQREQHKTVVINFYKNLLLL